MSTDNAAIRHCFAPEGCAESCARVHLPVACEVNALPRFGGATASALKKRCLQPADALNALRQAMDKGVFKDAPVAMVGISGPGDPLASAESTFELLRELRRLYTDISLCIGTNGLHGAMHADTLAELGVSHISLSVNTVDEALVPELYNWVRPGKKTMPRGEAGPLLVREQADALAAFVAKGIAVTVRTMIFPGINESQVADIALFAAAGSADAMLLCPWLPSEPEGTDSPVTEEEPPPAPAELIQNLQLVAAEHLPVIDAADVCVSPDAGLGLDKGMDTSIGLAALPKPSAERPNVAVATSDGFDINMHLGQARQFLIYGANNGLVTLLEARKAPEAGGGEKRWKNLAEVLSDCSYLVVSSAGQSPERVLANQGLRLVRTDGQIESVVDTLYGGGKKGKGRK